MVHEDQSEQYDVIQQNMYVQSDANHTTYFSGLAAAITESMAFARVPIAKPPLFNGDPLEYHSWKMSFYMMVSQKNSTPHENILFINNIPEPSYIQ